MTGEERGQLFILEVFYNSRKENKDLKPLEATKQIADKMAGHQAIKLMGVLYSADNIICVNPSPIKQIAMDVAKYYRISDIGVTYYNYLNNERDKDLLQEKKLRIDVKNAERIFKTYWWTFAMALVSLGVSIYLLILKLKGR